MDKELFEALEAYFKAVIDEKIADSKGWDVGIEYFAALAAREAVMALLEESK